jgi:hypothetical protein
MKRNLDLPILQLDGTPFVDNPTLKVIIYTAFTTPLQTDNNMPDDDKLKNYSLVAKTHKGGVVDLTADEIASIKSRICKVWNHVVIIGRAHEILEADYEGSNQDAFDAAVDVRDMPSGATKAPDAFTGS